jgi:hypothetical protein
MLNRCEKNGEMNFKGLSDAKGWGWERWLALESRAIAKFFRP